MPTTDTKLQLGMLGVNALGGLLGGADDSDEKQRAADRALLEQNQFDNRDDEFFQLLLQSMQNQGNTEQDLSSENLQRSLAFTQANPLGAEQNYRKGNTLGLQGLEALSGRQLARGTPSLASGFTDRPGVREAYSDANVDEAIRQRRIATAGIDPRAQQEIGGAGSDYASRLFGELAGGQQMRRSNAAAQIDMVGDRRNEIIQNRDAQLAAAQQPQEKEKGFWSKFGSVALPIAGLAANFIPGVGPLASMAIGAATGAAGGALAGGKKGAAMGAIGGGAAAHGLNQLPGQGNAPRTFNNKMTPQSLPGSMQQAHVGGGGQLQLPSSPNSGMGGGFAAAMNPQRPNIQSPRGLVGPSPSGPGQSLASMNLSQFAPNTFGSSPQPTGQTPNFMQNYQQGQQPPVGLSAPQAPRPSFDAGRFSDAKIGGMGAPINQQASQAFGNVAGPAMNAGPAGALAAGMMPLVGAGSAATLGGGLAATGAGALQRFAPQASNYMTQLGRVQKALPSPQGLLGPGVPKALLPQTTATGMEAQNVVAKLTEALKAYKGDPKASQQIIQMMQPYLSKIPSQGLAQ